MADIKLYRDTLFQLTVKAVNNLSRPDGPVHSLCVFAIYDVISELEPSSSIIAQRATAIWNTMEEIEKLRANREVNEALNAGHAPEMAPFNDLSLNSDVLVWHEGNATRNGRWTGLLTFLVINNKT